jgi:plastocyanin
MKNYAILLIALICGMLICGCVSLPTSQTQVTQTPQVTSQVPAGPTVTVIIKNRAFDPSSKTITVGTTVTWVNEDPTLHRVVHLPSVTQEERFNSGPLSYGQSYSYRFVETGTYEYGDPNIGGGRTARIIVE